MRACESCGEPFEGRSDKRYCTTACRMRSHRSARNAARTAAEDPVFRELVAAVDRGVLEPRLVASIAAAGANGQWRAAAWILERRFPERWAERRTGRTADVDFDADPFRARGTTRTKEFRLDLTRRSFIGS